LRKAGTLRVRQPLAELTVVVPGAADLKRFADVLADEVNVKQVRLLDLDDAAATSAGVTQRLTVNARAAGPRLGRQVQDVIRAAKAGDWELDPEGVPVCGGVPLQEGEFSLETVVDGDGAGTHAVAVLPGGGFVLLDTTVTPPLRAEGLARDVVRAVQQLRRDAGLAVGDRIRLTLEVDDDAEDLVAAVDGWSDLIARETLAVDVLRASPAPGSTSAATVSLGDGVSAGVSIERVA